MPSDEMDQVRLLLTTQRDEGLGMPAATIEQGRASLDGMATLFPLPVDVAVADADAGGVPGVWVTPPGADGRHVVLYLHGGAYTSGSSVSHRELAARIARAAGARALVLDYRRAPEHPFPAALDDALAAYRWLVADQGIAAGDLSVAGDSAGGGLATSLLLALRAAGDALPASLVLLSPWLDLTCSSESMTSKVDVEPMIDPEGLRAAGAAYAGTADLKDPGVSPLFGDLEGLPPVLVQVGTDEVLYDDSMAFTLDGRAAGVDVTLQVEEGAFHVWQAVATIPEAVDATDRIGAYLKAAWR